MELLVFALFGAGLLVCLFLDLNIVFAMAFGFVVFTVYGLVKGYSPKDLFKYSVDGIKTVSTILVIFALIGMMTALWRAGGTIPVIVCYACRLIAPSVFLMVTFLLCSGISFLIGSSFASAATMGVVCMTIGLSLGFPPALIGGSVLSGIFFGDRCSPVSTSAMLVAEQTHTDLYLNIKNMLKSALIPFLASCAAYYFLGLSFAADGDVPDLTELFGRGFNLHWLALLPAVVVLALSVMHIKVRWAMGASIICAVPVALLLQHCTVSQLIDYAINGYVAADPQIAQMMNGGGILSMLNVAIIITFAGIFSGIFKLTGLLNNVKALIGRLVKVTNSYIAMVVVSAFISMLCCNQSLAIILTIQLLEDEYDNSKEARSRFACDVADSAVIVPVLVPWCIAGAVPIATIGAPQNSHFFIFYIFALILWHGLRSLVKK